MMDRFWSWLMHANARRVLIGTVVALVAVSGWGVWREINPALPNGENPPASRKDLPYQGVALLGFIDEQLASGQTAVPGNPFLSSDAPWIWNATPSAAAIRPSTNLFAIISIVPPAVRMPRETIIPPPIRVTTTTTTPSTKPPNPQVTKKPPAARGSQERTVNLTYRGMFRRPDGHTVALIEDPESTKPIFYPVGTALFGNRLTEAELRAVEIRLPDGRTVTLPFGEPTDVKDSR